MSASKDEVLKLLDDYMRRPMPSGPVSLSTAYRRAVERWEELPENEEGAAKEWVLTADRAFRNVVARARPVE